MAHATYADVERAIDKLSETARAIRLQRDDLFAAVIGLRDILQDNGLFDPLDERVRAARAAIAKAKA